MSSTYKFINCVSEDDSPVHDHIPQYHTVVADPSQLFSYLLHLITHDQLVTGGKSKIIVFLSTTKTVQLCSNLLNQVAHQVLPSGRKTKLYEMHAKREMATRMNISKNFRADTSGSSILITTDVSARGVDYPGVSRVIQMGVPATGDMYIHRVGRTGRGDNKTGRGDLVLCSWEMGFLKRQLSSMPLKPLIMSDMLQETKELAESKDAEIDGPGTTPDSSHRLSEIEPLSREMLENVGENAANDLFMAQLGFYFGRINEMGIRKEEALGGLQNWAQGLFGLESAPTISFAMQQRLGLLSNSSSNQRTRPSSSWGGRGNQDSRAPYQSSRAPYQSSRAPWEGRGNQSSRAPLEGRGNQRPWEGRENRPTSKFGSGERSGGFGSSSFGSRNSNNDSYTPRSSQYGSRNDEGKSSYRAPRFSNSRKDEYSTSQSSGSRDYANPGAARYGSSRNSKSGSSYGSRPSSSDNDAAARYDWQ
jgi:ATP-dependent RNA helicase MSS116